MKMRFNQTGLRVANWARSLSWWKWLLAIDFVFVFVTFTSVKQFLPDLWWKLYHHFDLGRELGHVRAGRARLGTLELAYPEYTQDESRAAMAFVRAHELEILRTKHGRPSLEARVTHVNVARSVVKVHVYSDAFGIALTVDVGWDGFTELRLSPGDVVHVSPRQMRVYVQEQREGS